MRLLEIHSEILNAYEMLIISYCDTFNGEVCKIQVSENL